MRRRLFQNWNISTFSKSTVHILLYYYYCTTTTILLLYTFSKSTVHLLYAALKGAGGARLKWFLIHLRNMEMDRPPACYFASVQDGKQEIYLEWP